MFEREYRRLLKQLILQVFSPDYEKRADNYFYEYRLHAPALFQDKDKVFDKKAGGYVMTSNGRKLVDEFDRAMSPNGTLTADDRRFGANIETWLDESQEKFAHDHPDEPMAFKRFEATWRTLPPLAQVIAAKLDSEVGVKVEKILSTEIVTELSDEDQLLYETAKKALVDAGYVESVQKPVLEYAKLVKVWAHKD